MTAGPVLMEKTERLSEIRKAIAKNIRLNMDEETLEKLIAAYLSGAEKEKDNESE